jgi:membrane protease YdiL (CAAX protease family)
MFGSAQRAYLMATRHPWPCFLFLLPLLAVYEGGVFWLGGGQPDSLRNGADAWIRLGLEHLGLDQAAVVPVLLALIFLGWSWIWRDNKPGDVLGVVTGMAIESVVFALGLWGLCRLSLPFLEGLGITLAYPVTPNEDAGRVVTFVGAGIYEEALFRLLILGGSRWLLRQVGVPAATAAAIAVLTSAALFSAAHHIGPFGEPFHAGRFVFRFLAGLFFALVFQFRGFGVAAGAHACYDVMVGIAVV